MSEEFQKDGVVYKRIGHDPKAKRHFGQKKWALVYVNLIGSSLHYYKEEEDDKPKGTIELNTLEFSQSSSKSRQWCFAMKNDTSDYLFSCEDEIELKEWITALEAGKKKTPCAPLLKEKRMSRASSLAFKTKKNLAGAVASTPLGKKAIRAKAPEELRNLVNAIKVLVDKDPKATKKGADVEDVVFKIGIKCYFLMDNSKIAMKDVLIADIPFRKALELLLKCHDHAKFTRNPSDALLKQKFEDINKDFVQAAELLTKLLTPHMKTQNVVLVSETAGYLSDPERMLRIFKDDTLSNELQTLMYAAEHYTQFHYYAD